jgi:PAS domain S-box-containing protein
MDRLRVLLLEDDARDAQTVEELFSLNTLPATFHRVQSEDEFRNALRDFNPDVILAEYVLPGFHGSHALNLAHDLVPDTPFIFVTGTLGEERAVESLKQGAADYVLKRNLARLVPSAQRALERSRERKQQKRLEAELQRKTHDLSERVKEVGCLYSVFQALANADRPLHDTLKIVVDLLPGGLQFPLDACAKISLEAYSVTTNNFQKPHAAIVAPIVLHGVQAGTAEVGYLSSRPDESDDPFLSEERDLVHTLAQQIGGWYERRKSTERLRAGEEEYRLLFESNPLSMYVYDAQTLEFLAVNESATHTYGYTREEFLRMKIGDILPEGDIAKLEKFVRTTSGKFSSSGEWRFKRKDGRIVDVEIVSHAIGFPGRRARLVVASDITERKKEQSAQREVEARFTAFMEYLPGVAFIKDGHGRYLFVNKMMESILQTPKEGILGRTDRDLVPENNAREFARNDAAVRRKRKALDVIESTNFPAGPEEWLMVKFPIAGGEKGETWLGGIGVNVTERQKTEKALKESERQYRDTIELSPIGIYRSKPDGKIVLANRALAHALGYRSEGALLGRNLGRDVCFGPADRRRLLRTYARERASSQVEVRWKKKNGAPLWIELAAHTVRDDKGRYMYFEGFASDITDRKREDGERQRRIRELSTLNHVGAACSVALHENALIETVTAILGRHFQPRNFGFLLIDRESGMLHHHPSFVVSGTRVQRRDIPFGEGLTGRVAKTGKPLRLADVSKVKSTIRPDRTVRSEICVPLLVGTRVTGVIEAESERGGAFTEADQRLLLTIAGQVGAVLERLRSAQDLRQSEQQMRKLAARFDAVREGERMRIAREIHDDLGQSLTGLKMDMSWLVRRLTNPEKSDKVRSMSNLIDATIKSVRRIATELRPGILDDLGLFAAIEWQGEEFAARTGIPCKVHAPPVAVELNPQATTAAFRIFQEALTNIIRHAHATKVQVTLKKLAKSLTLEVADNGRGVLPVDLKRKQSLGILGMRERASMAGGTLSIRPGRKKGTILTVTLPLMERKRGRGNGVNIP